MINIKMLFLFIIILTIFSAVVVGRAPYFEDKERQMHPDLKYEAPSVLKQDELLSNFWQKEAEKIVNDNLQKPINTNVAKNIIFFLGDGLGVQTITAARTYANKNEGTPLFFETLPYTGMSKTYCVDRQTADSACSVTAYLCGVKANFDTIGVNANVKVEDCMAGQIKENQTPSIAKWAIDAKKSAGIVTTTSITDASPVGVFGHVAFRDWESDIDVQNSGCNINETHDIARQLIRNDVGSKLKVVFAGGRRRFIPENEVDEEGEPGIRIDGVNLIEEWKKNKTEKGQYIWNKEGLLKLNTTNTEYVLGLFKSGHLQYNLDTIEQGREHLEPTLSEMVDKAIDILSANDDGFFLFVEGGRIDHAHHGNYAKLALDETKEFSKAIELAMKKINVQETLVVVTADHSHSFSYAGYPTRGRDILGTVGDKADDNIDHMILSYANGLGYYKHVNKEGVREDPSTMARPADFRYPATIPKDGETHGGEDVTVYASGPWSHLFTGNYEQHTIAHMMAFASCIGNGLKACD